MQQGFRHFRGSRIAEVVIDDIDGAPLSAKPGPMRVLSAVSRIFFGLSLLFGGDRLLAQFYFEPAQNYDIGHETFYIASGDFNNDGRTDVVTREKLLFGDGAGGFSSSAAIPPNDYGVAADLNRDGNLDLIGRAPVTVQLGNGDGSFRPPIDLGFSTMSLPATGDFNEDGLEDIVIVHEFKNFAVFLSSRDTGSYEAPIIFPASPTGRLIVFAIVIADFVEDGHLDIAVSSEDECEGVIVHPGNGTGGFLAPIASESAPFDIGFEQAKAMACADFNDDNHLDVVWTNTVEHTSSVLLGDGAGQFFFDPDRYYRGGIPPGIVCYPPNTTVVDLNQDGREEIVFPNLGCSSFSTVTVFTDQTDGVFQSAFHIDVVSRPSWALATDMDNDGRDDLVVASSNSTELSVVINRSPLGYFSGLVRFQDGTLMERVHVRVYAHGTENLIDSIRTDENGRYIFTKELAQGEYSLVATVPIPVGLWHAPQNGIVFQPMNLDPAPDVMVNEAGELAFAGSPDFEFPFPVLLLHGLTLDSPTAAHHFDEMQQYLAGDLETALQSPRKAFVPIVPELTVGDSYTYDEYYDSFVRQSGRINALLQPRFSVVGYSQGGLVARRLVSERGGVGIHKVIQVATPNGGSCAAVPICPIPFSERARRTCPLRPSAVELTRLNLFHRSGYGVPFYLLAGTEYRPFYAVGVLANTCLLGRLSDGIVSAGSVIRLRQMDYDIREEYAVADDHIEIIGNMEVIRKVHDWLLQEE